MEVINWITQGVPFGYYDHLYVSIIVVMVIVGIILVSHHYGPHE
jgi:ABC-type phosphate transport system auxiliary subunit